MYWKIGRAISHYLPGYANRAGDTCDVCHVMECPEPGSFVLSKRSNELTTNVLIALLKTEIMPYVKIEVTREGVTREQKQELIAGVTQLITDVLDKDPHLTHVVIQEVELDDWGYAGEQVSVLREKGITAKRNQ